MQCGKRGRRTDDGAVEVLDGVADGLVGAGVADLLEELEVAVGVAGLSLGGAAEDGGDVWQKFPVRVEAWMVDVDGGWLKFWMVGGACTPSGGVVGIGGCLLSEKRIGAVPL